MVQHNTISSFVADLAAGKPEAILANCNDPGYALKKVIEYDTDMCVGIANLTRYFSTYYMGETVHVPFKLPIIVVVVNNYRYELQQSEDPSENIIIASLLPDDYEVRQDIDKLNYIIDNNLLYSKNSMWHYISTMLPDLYNYLTSNSESPSCEKYKKLLIKLGAHLD